MATLGEKLRNARLEKNVTQSKAAEDTRIKFQIIEGLEKDDFSRIAAPIYGRGFVKLYAEYLGLDPAPLVAEYMAKMNPAQAEPEPPVRPVHKERGSRRPSAMVKAFSVARARSKAALVRLREKVKPFLKLPSAGKFERLYIAFAEDPWDSLVALGGVLIVVLFILSMLSRCVR